MVYYAISELETVLEFEPTMFQAMKNLAILYQEAGFKNKAIEMWERALSICEDDESKQKMREHLMSLL
jgi:Tfp pilus assembly protein PilF